MTRTTWAEPARCPCGARLRGSIAWCPLCHRPVGDADPPGPARRAPALSAEAEQRMYRRYRRERRRERIGERALGWVLDLLWFLPWL